MTSLSVGELLREAEREVRALTIERLDRDPGQLVVGYDALQTSTLAALQTVGCASRPTGRPARPVT